MIPVPDQHTTKDRLLSLLDIVIKRSKLNAAFLPVIKNFATRFINDMDDHDLEKAIKDLRDKFIPWLLGEVVTHEQDTP